MRVKVGAMALQVTPYGEVAAAGYQSIALPGVELAGMDDAAFQKTRETLRRGPLVVRCRPRRLIPRTLSQAAPSYSSAFFRILMRSLSAAADWAGPWLPH